MGNCGLLRLVIRLLVLFREIWVGFIVDIVFVNGCVCRLCVVCGGMVVGIVIM